MRRRGAKGKKSALQASRPPFMTRQIVFTRRHGDVAGLAELREEAFGRRAPKAGEAHVRVLAVSRLVQ